MKNGTKDLARKVKDYRLSREMTQDQAAAMFRLSKSTYVRIELGFSVGDLTRAKIDKILSAVEVAA